MRAAFLLLVTVVACQKPVEKQHIPPTGTPCGPAFCSADEVCVDRACVKQNDCHVIPKGHDIFGNALAAVGLDRCSAEIPEDFLGPSVPEYIKHDPFRLPHYEELHHHPLELPGWGRRLVDAFAAPSDTHAVSASIAEAAARLGHEILERPYTHSVDSNAPLAVAVAELIQAQGGTPDESAIASDAADVPMPIQKKAAVVLYALSNATQARNDAFAAVQVDFLATCVTDLLFPGPSCSVLDPTNDADREQLVTGVNWEELFQSAYDLARAVEDADLAAEAGASGFHFDQSTLHGRVVLADASSQTYEEATPPIALLLDFGGDDIYRSASGATRYSEVPVAVHVDVAGNDTYGYEEKPGPNDTGRLPSDYAGRWGTGDVTIGQTSMSRSDRQRQGASRGGIGLLFDLAGNDRYRALRMSQGFGALGVGVLADRAGDDTYEAEAGAQGAALFGIGLLLDGAGNDTHRLYSEGQGFGYVGGFGALLDGAGDDVYFANPGDPSEGGDPLYYSAQLPGTGNSSFAQGAGFGRRYDDMAGKGTMSGGLGLLADLGGGNDQYTASVFGQGTGYWFGTGVLLDDGGDDRYDGKWYVRGSAAHFALALFRDEGGNDLHGTGGVAPVATSSGVGHDWSVGWLVDLGGDDTYNASSLSLGSGNACGWGFFIDVSGKDTYAPRGNPTLGAFGDPTNCSYTTGTTIGLFVDGAGSDSYSVAGTEAVRSDQLIPATEAPAGVDAKGVGVDGEGTVLILP